MADVGIGAEIARLKDRAAEPELFRDASSSRIVGLETSLGEALDRVTSLQTQLMDLTLRFKTMSEQVILNGDALSLGFGTKFLSGDSGQRSEIQVTIGGSQTGWKVKRVKRG